MPRAASNGIEIEYESFGDEDDPTLLLVSGLGGQLVSWPLELVSAFVDRGFRVVRFDNRDIGLSTKVDADLDVLAAIMSALSGGPAEAPYLLTDMAADTAGLLDALGVERAHVVGRSMGGMIAQTLAIEHPDRVRSLTSFMSTTGNPEYGQPHPEAMAVLLERPPADRDRYLEHQVASFRTIGSPDHFEEEAVRAVAAESYDRCFHPVGVGHQLLAVVASGSRDEGLRRLDVPTLVLHGTADKLVDPSGGEHTAEVVPHAELVWLEGMGHDLPSFYWPQIVSAVTALAARAEQA